MALILQALFFGDGGILAIFANCLNMGIILPFVGYPATGSSRGSRQSCRPGAPGRRASAPMSGITVSALAVGIELGLQPCFSRCSWARSIQPLWTRRGDPSDAASTPVGASMVEALITALGMAYLQKQHPEYLTSLRSIFAGPEAVEGQVQAPTRADSGCGTVLALVVLFIGRADNGRRRHRSPLRRRLVTGQLGRCRGDAAAGRGSGGCADPPRLASCCPGASRGVVRRS